MEQFKFSLSNFIWWTKGWYKPVHNIDLYSIMKKILYLDGYPFVNSKDDVLRILLSRFDEYNKYNISLGKEPIRMYLIYDRFNQYKRVYDCSDFDACIYAIKSYACMIEYKDFNAPLPVYTKKLYKFGFTSMHHKPGMTYKELNYITHK